MTLIASFCAFRVNFIESKSDNLAVGSSGGFAKTFGVLSVKEYEEVDPCFCKAW